MAPLDMFLQIAVVLTVINLTPLGQAGDALKRAIIQRSECNFNQSLFQLIHLQ